MTLFKKKNENPTNVENKKNDNINITKYKSKNAISTIKKDTPVYVISMDLVTKEIVVMSMIGNDTSTINIFRLPYKSRSLDEEFFIKFTDTLTKFLADKPSKVSTAVYIVLPNCCVSNLVVNIPTIKKNQMDNQLGLSIENNIKNYKELIINKFVVSTNKQYSTYYLTMIKKELLATFFTALSNCKLYSKMATYTANTTLNAVLTIRSKSRNHSFLFIDIKENSSLFVICGKGRTLGYFPLQYGYKAIASNKLVYENMITDHSLAEITVLNAEEKAKAKQLTMMGSSDTSDETEVKQSTENTTENSSIPSENNQKVFTKKVPKKLPKFMQRPLPETIEETNYENFRLFVKWALLLIRKNEGLGPNNKPEYVLVNLPNELNHVIELTNREKEENMIEFIPFNDNLNISKDIIENLDLYGALFMNTYNKNHNF